MQEIFKKNQSKFICILINTRTLDLKTERPSAYIPAGYPSTMYVYICI